jgi:hypothetical protein
MPFTVVETSNFLRSSAKVWSDAERSEFVDWIAENPEVGDVIRGVAPLRKVRWSRQGVGKSGGARVIYFNRLANGQIVLIGVYAKGELENLSDAALQQLKQLEKNYE